MLQVLKRRRSTNADRRIGFSPTVRIGVKDFQILVILVLTLSPLLFLSQIAVESVAGDNKNYKAFYDAVRNTSSLESAYFNYLQLTGASEPISFIFFYVLSKLGVSYYYSVLIKNIAIVFVIWRLICRHFVFNFLLVSLILYLSTDYYLFRVFAELQRLGVAVLFLFASAWFFDRKVLFLFLATLSHFQVVLFSPLLIFLKVNRTVLILGLAIVGAVFSVVLRVKLAYYLNFSFADIIKFSVVTLPFLAVCLSTGRKTFKLWAALTAAFLIFAGLIGTDRVIIMYWEILVAASFIVVDRKGWRAGRFLIFFIFIYVFAIPYNIYRIFGETADFLG